jgi:hypothetical protein
MINVVINAVVREWLCQTLGAEAARQGLGNLVRTQMVAFYVDDRVLLARCPEWLQSSFNILISLFKCIGLCSNAQKMKVMTCVPGKIRVSLSEEVYNDYC